MGIREAPRAAQLEAAYNRLHQEQVTLFQRFQMTLEMRRNELLQEAPSISSNHSIMGTESNRILDYDENVRQQQARQERLLRYDREINQAYARYLELSDRKKVLHDQIHALSLPPGQ